MMISSHVGTIWFYFWAVHVNRPENIGLGMIFLCFGDPKSNKNNFLEF